MANQYQGVAYVRCNGTEYASADDATLTPGGVTRATVKGSRVYGYQETPEEATVEATFYNNAETDVLALKDITNATIEFETDVGQTYLLANAWVVDAVTLSSKGEIKIKFAAVQCKRV
ncbi:TPA: phage tail tube protein [Pasteurella multocida]|nr:MULTISPECIES: phage tail tube protein [Pasteurellaceae]APB78613.1 phage tail protein [Pasteurella multocida]ATC22289.1 phage tail protein [Pasteurella multocida]AXN95965.1 phage tail protein [Pasteurella multocida]AXN99768.1 phage tail protein [Pasteurella multocida]AXO01977.1 phage tail protein [Pasteurella multocida]